MEERGKAIDLVMRVLATAEADGVKPAHHLAVQKPPFGVAFLWRGRVCG